VRRPAATATLEVRVTDRSGNPAANAQVTADGPSSREGTTDTNGIVTFRTMAAGTYRVRAEGDGFVTLEKELAVRSGAPSAADFALSAAPAPPPPAPPPPQAPPAESEPAPPAGVTGPPVIVSIPDLAERSLSSRNGARNVPIGCSGVGRSRLILVRDPIPSASRDDADEMLYLVAGEAMLTLGSREQIITPGSFALVPRSTNYAVTRRGRNPAILLSIVAGEPCLAEPGS
jgi:mannose-6-phosphate isomerase-like protein (cupin superfamily)